MVTRSAWNGRETAWSRAVRGMAARVRGMAASVDASQDLLFHKYGSELHVKNAWSCNVITHAELLINFRVSARILYDLQDKKRM